MFAIQSTLAIAIAVFGVTAIPDGLFVIAVVATAGQMIYLLAIFGFGCDSDLLDPNTTYPAHMLRLPADTRWLACLPFFLGGTLVIALLCFAEWFVFAPARSSERFEDLGIPPLKWSVLFTTLLAWMQATLWANYRSAWQRAALLTFALIVPIAWVSGLIVRDLSDQFAIIGLLTSIPLALCLASYNLSQARRGGVGGLVGRCFGVLQSLSSIIGKKLQRPSLQKPSKPVWGLRGRGWQLFDRRIRRWCIELFQFNWANQVWLEWRCNCLPILIVHFCFLIFLCTLSCIWPFLYASRQMMVVSPFLIAAVGGIGMGNLNRGSDSKSMPAFYSSRPFSSLSFVRAKWIACLLTAVAMAFVSIVLFLVFSMLAGPYGGLATAWQWWSERFPAGQLVLGILSAIVFYVGIIWTLLVQLFPITMTGRSWLQTLVIGTIIMVAIAFLAGTAIDHSSVAPWTLVLLLVCKIGLGVFSVSELLKYEILDEGHIFQLGLSWFMIMLILSLALYGFVCEFAGFGSIILILPAVFLLMPFSRVLLAPLALHANRHR